MSGEVRQLLNGLGDAKVRSLYWTADDLVLELILPANGPSARSVGLRFQVVTNLRIDFDYGEYVGYPLIFSAEAKEIDHARWKVTFEFGAAPEGVIDFECSDVSRTEGRTIPA